MAIEKYIAADNMTPVIENDVIPAATQINTVLADAYIESVANAEKVSEIIEDLENKAEELKTEDPETPEVKQNTMYTKKLTLDESIEDFRTAFEDDTTNEEDDYLDYDMFNFIYGIVTNDWPKPKNPLNHPIRKFRYTGDDDYLKTNSNEGTSQVSTDINYNIVVYADDAEAFNDVRDVCTYYNIKCQPVKPRANKNSKWAFSMTIEVPKTSEGYPMMAEDFFAMYGMTLSDVIEDHKVGAGKSANWGKTYNKEVAKDIENAKKAVNDTSVANVYKKYHDKAAWSNDPIENFIKEMFAELDASGLNYSKKELKKRFEKDFEDDYEEDDMEEGLLSNAISNAVMPVGSPLGALKSVL